MKHNVFIHILRNETINTKIIHCMQDKRRTLALVTSIAWSGQVSSGSDIDSMYQRNITGDYICVNCGYTNKYKQNMQKHVETHIDVPRAICKFCYRTFKTTNSLQSHISTKHREENSTMPMSLS